MESKREITFYEEGELGPQREYETMAVSFPSSRKSSHVSHSKTAATPKMDEQLHFKARRVQG